MQRRLALLMQAVLNERCNALIDATASEMRSDLDAFIAQLVMPRRFVRPRPNALMPRSTCHIRCEDSSAEEESPSRWHKTRLRS